MTEVKLFVLSDVFPEKPVEVIKNGPELPNKVFVEYASKMKQENPDVQGLNTNPYMAYRYNSYDDYLAKKQPRVVNMQDSIDANGFKPQRTERDPPMVICFIFNAAAA